MKLKFGKIYKNPDKPQWENIRLLEEKWNSNLFLIAYEDDGYSIANSFSQQTVDKFVELKPYESFTVDQRVYVSNNELKWHKRHFSHVSEGGLACCFDIGRTSFTAQDDSFFSEWPYCISEEEYEKIMSR